MALHARNLEEKKQRKNKKNIQSIQGLKTIKHPIIIHSTFTKKGKERRRASQTTEQI